MLPQQVKQSLLSRLQYDTLIHLADFLTWPGTSFEIQQLQGQVKFQTTEQ